MILVGNNSVIMQKVVHCGGLPPVVQKRENSFRNIVRKWDSLFYEENAIPMNEVVAVFVESELRIKKIILLETLGLSYSDGEFDDSEKGFINEYAKKIGLTDEDVDKQTEAIKEYLAALKKVAEAIS